MRTDIKDFDYAVTNSGDEIVALFRDEKTANLYVSMMAEEEELQVVSTYFNEEATITISF